MKYEEECKRYLDSMVGLILALEEPCHAENHPSCADEPCDEKIRDEAVEKLMNLKKDEQISSALDFFKKYGANP